MVLSTVDYSGIAIPLVINKKDYLPLKADIEELGHVVVTFGVLGKNEKKRKITRQGYIDQHGILTIQIDKHKVYFGVASGFIKLAENIQIRETALW